MRRIASDRLTTAFALGACASVALLCWFGYRAIDEWRERSLLLAERQASETADLLVNALTRDMSGAQTLVLPSPQWMQFAPDHPHEVNELVASAFARYPYPEAFFAWRAGGPFARTAFFYRVGRRPSWLQPDTAETAFPVVTGRAPAASEALLQRVMQDAAAGRTLSVFHFVLNQREYQVVAQLAYRDIYRERIDSVTGFAVDVAWVRQHYFVELARQVWNIGGAPEAGLTMQIRDRAGTVVAGSAFDDRGSLTQQRRFNLVFFDSESAFPVAAGFVPEEWSIVVSGARSPFLVQDHTDANRVLAFAGISSVLFVTGLVLTVLAGRASVRLATMRSDFVSAVTHELKTPMATIKAAAQTLTKDRLTGMSVQTCGRIVVMETARLTRLVENLLAYSRVTEMADTYAFGVIEIAAVFNDIQEDFEARLDHQGFELDITIVPPELAVRGDRFALRLLFGNLVDNAIKYARDHRFVSLSAVAAANAVILEVADAGIGIPEEDLPHVIKRFVRGRSAPGGGSGLGLAIASAIAKDHGGTLTIQSAEGRGTTVTVTLPLA